ncbi:hypothetical protein PGT21_022213 [Puccinia graminis f. sp. tritici]|uniref:Uncharacterized protein n=1 Tax=Puccinia graminis f. sp. tritici TaxID=56615 RepID=A0A5B0MI97_PUCGR|nr:hypothetical protein PGT21_022213 [Puccinia graminis f. sp. tritici]KAA1075490.1 hypothetical protein PGTUg99_015803 [Puccinia graminis f. sp. tritici]
MYTNTYKSMLGVLLILYNCVFFALAETVPGFRSGGSHTSHNLRNFNPKLQSTETSTGFRDMKAAETSKKSEVTPSVKDSKKVSPRLSAQIAKGKKSVITDLDLAAKDIAITKFTKARKNLEGLDKINKQIHNKIISSSEELEILKILLKDHFVSELKKYGLTGSYQSRRVGALKGMGEKISSTLLSIWESAKEEFKSEHLSSKLDHVLHRSLLREQSHKNHHVFLLLKKLRKRLKEDRDLFKERERTTIKRLSVIENMGFEFSSEEVHLIGNMARRKPYLTRNDGLLVSEISRKPLAQRMTPKIRELKSHFLRINKESEDLTIVQILRVLEWLEQKAKDGEPWTKGEVQIHSNISRMKGLQYIPKDFFEEEKVLLQNLSDKRDLQNKQKIYFQAFAALCADPKPCSEAKQVLEKLNDWWNDGKLSYDKKVSHLVLTQNQMEIIQNYSYQYKTQLNHMVKVHESMKKLEKSWNKLRNMEEFVEALFEELSVSRRYYAAVVLNLMEMLNLKISVTNKNYLNEFKRSLKLKEITKREFGPPIVHKMYQTSGFPGYLLECAAELNQKAYSLNSDMKYVDLLNHLNSQELDTLYQLQELTPADLTFTHQSNFAKTLQILRKADYRSKFKLELFNEENLFFLERLIKLQRQEIEFSKSKLWKIKNSSERIRQISGLKKSTKGKKINGQEVIKSPPSKEIRCYTYPSAVRLYAAEQNALPKDPKNGNTALIKFT